MSTDLKTRPRTKPAVNVPLPAKESDAISVLEAITQSGREAAAVAAETGHYQDLRDVMKVGCDARHGDMYIMRIERLPTGIKSIKPQERLVNRVSRGAEHDLVSLDGIEQFVPEKRPLVSMYIRAANDFLIDHPDHRQLHFPAGVYEIRHQRDPRGEARLD